MIAQKKALDAPWDPKKMRAVSQGDRDLEAIVQATTGMLEEDDSSDGDNSTINTEEDDSVGTMDFEIDPVQEAEEFLFNKASSNASVTTLDNKQHRVSPKSHEEQPSPSKKHKSDSKQSNVMSALQMDLSHETVEGAETGSVPNQHNPISPGPLGDPGDGL